MNDEGAPEIGDTLTLRNGRKGEVIHIEDHWFIADKITIRYSNGQTEVVTGHQIVGIEDGN